MAAEHERLGEVAFGDARFDEVVALTTRAFHPYLVWAHVFEDAATRTAPLTWVFQRLVWLATHYDGAQYHVLRAPDTGCIVGCGSAALIGPRGCTSESLLAHIHAGLALAPLHMTLPQLYRLKVLGDDTGAVTARDTKGMRDGWWYIREVSVDPECQGQGLGSRLVAEMVRQSLAQRALPVYLMTNTAKNVRLYERIGFRVVSETHLTNDATVPIWGMVLTPQ